MNKYDVEHAVTAHPKMSMEEWSQAYRMAWETYYTREHMERVMRRVAATGGNVGSVFGILMIYSRFWLIERVSPLQGGVFRLKFRRDRRPELPVEPAWVFYPKYLWQTLRNNGRLMAHWLRIEIIRQRVRRDPNRRAYMDEALTPVVESETETMALFTHSASARDAVKHIRHVEEVTHGAAHPSPSAKATPAVPTAVPAE